MNLNANTIKKIIIYRFFCLGSKIGFVLVRQKKVRNNPSFYRSHLVIRLFLFLVVFARQQKQNTSRQ